MMRYDAIWCDMCHVCVCSCPAELEKQDPACAICINLLSNIDNEEVRGPPSLYWLNVSKCRIKHKSHYFGFGSRRMMCTNGYAARSQESVMHPYRTPCHISRGWYLRPDRSLLLLTKAFQGCSLGLRRFFRIDSYEDPHRTAQNSPISWNMYLTDKHPYCNASTISRAAESQVSQIKYHHPTPWGSGVGREKGDFDQGKDLLSNLCAGHLPAKRPCEWDWDTLQQRPRQRPRLDYAAPFGISHVYHVSTSISRLILYCTDRCMVCSQAGSKKPGHIQTWDHSLEARLQPCDESRFG